MDNEQVKTIAVRILFRPLHHQLKHLPHPRLPYITDLYVIITMMNLPLLSA